MNDKYVKIAEMIREIFIKEVGRFSKEDFYKEDIIKGKTFKCKKQSWWIL